MLFRSRAASSTWTLTPRLRQFRLRMPEGDWSNPTADRAALGVLWPSGWQRDPGDPYRFLPRDDSNGDGVPDNPYGLPMWGGRLNQLENDPDFQSQWDTVVQPTYSNVGGGDPDAANLRDFMYAVIPSPSGGTGRLVRAYRARIADEAGGVGVIGAWPGQYLHIAGATGMKIDRVVSDHVVRIVFDTFRTDEALDVNQVRVRVSLLRENLRRPGTFYAHAIDCVLAMRARISRRDDDFTRLGGDAGHVGFTY